MKQTVLERKSCSGVNRLVSARLKSADGVTCDKLDKSASGCFNI